MNDIGISPAISRGRWLQPLHDWPAAVLQQLEGSSCVARIVVASVRGSAPREPGACMLIGQHEASGTIGGGQLEWAAMEAARQMLADPQSAAASVHKFVLASDLAQCCGGVVELWIERYTAADRPFLELARAASGRAVRLTSRLTPAGMERTIVELPAAASPACARLSRSHGVVLEESLGVTLPSLFLYGAGHVGQALARVLATLAVQTRWIDSRSEVLPDDIGGCVQIMHATEPLMTLASAPPQSHFIVMTHSHSLDYALCRTILQRGEFASLGVIGSHSKAARFRSRLAREGLTAAQIAALQCPLGIEGLHSKRPEVIAIAIAAQLLQTIEARALRYPATTAPVVPACPASPAGCAACDVERHASLKASLKAS